ncbi:MAG: phosphate ABC transporter permease PstA [Deltaproteobacteria bacterium]|nr:phosphate ABC transporter permease PstA [Deltaproteobacteria bacterium]
MADSNPPRHAGRQEMMVWAAGSALTVILLCTLTLVMVVMANGLGHFWPSPVEQLELTGGERVMGEVTDRNMSPDGGERIQVKTANRDLYGLDFRWISQAQVTRQTRPERVVLLERKTHGNFIGTFHGFEENGNRQHTQEPMAVERLNEEISKARQGLAALDPLREDMMVLTRETERLTRRAAKLRYQGAERNQAELIRLAQEEALTRTRFDQLNHQFAEGMTRLEQRHAILADAMGREVLLPLTQVVRVVTPNDLSWFGRVGVYASRWWELLSANPRESNTEGGLFPAMFGTVMMVFLMSLVSLPLGVVAAVYLSEYARQGMLVRLVRVAVYNLAGVPSIVYGVFGLGFFVYGVGGVMDQVFFPERLPTPTFGTGGILWASLTLALLTVPVVIVSTEEGFASIPKGVREGSISLGATRFQTLTRVLLPAATPGIITGFVLAMARAAGEVAPLMITGVVKMAPSLPLDGTFPFVHLDRKFMHLGFHIFDVGFQSPNVEAAKPMVFVTTLLLLGMVLLLSLTAIVLRNRMRRRYGSSTF